MSIPSCCSRERAEALRDAAVSNGIDYIEVVDGPAVPDADRQRFLHVHLLNPPAGDLLTIRPDDVVISGGTRVRGIRTLSLAWTGSTLVVEVDRPGDFSLYTLELAKPSGHPLGGIDDRLSRIDFSFKIDCPADFDCDDCRRDAVAPREEAAPEIDYLARDYAGMRRLMLDRIAVTAPQWTERSPADVGVAIVEALAYSADRVSYRLDAAGMESTLATARRRTSARRHARLVDYRTHDGANARVWAQIGVDAGLHGVVLPRGTALLTRVDRVPEVIEPGSQEWREALASAPTVFETMHDVRLDADAAELRFYTWGEDDCALPPGATRATLRGHPPIRENDVLVLKEQRGPRTGLPSDADPAHRHPVRLIAVRRTTDPRAALFADPPAGDAVTEVEWHPDDALPFGLKIAGTADAGLRFDLGVALGNIVLADHGRTIDPDEFADLPAERFTVPEPADALAYPASCPDGLPRHRPARFALALPYTDVTMTARIGRALLGDHPQDWARFDPTDSAASVLTAEPELVRPDVLLADDDGFWFPTRDLLATDRSESAFVVEVEAGGAATARFGDGEYGRRPPSGTRFTVSMRRGTGPAGNVGADSLVHVVTDVDGIAGARNPVPARGGTAPEPVERTREDAPAAFAVPQRAVTPADYAEVAQRHPQVQRAVATQRWTGSWHTIFLAIDRAGGRPVDPEFEGELRAFLARFRMAGHDLDITGPQYVALDVVLGVCALPDFYRADVRRAVLERLGRGLRSYGSRGFFHPDEFTFGRPVTLSALLAAAQEVEGVHLVEPRWFRRRGDPRVDGIAGGELPMGRLEIARLDNDPSFTERGTLELEMEGGR